MFVTHLECSLTGERYEAGKIYNLSRAGKPLMVRYDLDRARQSLTRDNISTREKSMWRWRELLPLPEGVEPVSLGEPDTPILQLSKTGGPTLLFNCANGNKYPLADRSKRLVLSEADPAAL